MTLAEWFLAAAATACVGFFGVAATVLAVGRRRELVLAVPRPLAPGRLVQIDAGDHRGLAGWVYRMAIDAGTGRPTVTVRLQLNDELVTVPRADVSPLFG